MKTELSFLIGMLLLFSCHQDGVDKNANIHRNTLQNQDTIVRMPKSQNDSQTIQDSVSGTLITSDILQEYTGYPDIIKNHLSDFYTFNLTNFNCSEIENFQDQVANDDIYHVNINRLKVFKSIDSIHFSNCKVERDSISLNDFYLFSVEKSILDYYPITIFNYYVAESPMFLILFDKKGHFVNGIEVANVYGEAESGCLNSYFVNDSTLVREYQWDELDENENVIENAYQKTEKLVIHKNGSFSIVESKSDSALEKELPPEKNEDPELYWIKDYSYQPNPKDTLVGLDYFDKPDVLDNIRFEYAKLLLNEADTTDSNTLKIYNKISSFIFKQIKFDATKHKIKKVDSSQELLVDGEHAYGTDGFVDCLKWEFDNIEIIQFGKHIKIPKKYYANFFNPNLSKNDIDIYELPYNRMIIKFSGGDAACSYRAALFFRENKIIKSIAVAGD